MSESEKSETDVRQPRLQKPATVQGGRMNLHQGGAVGWREEPA